MKYKCLIWGIGGDYEKIINQLQFEKSKGNIDIVALIARTQDIVERTLDGIMVIDKGDINNIEFDYLIIASALYYKEIYREACNMGVKEKK